MEVCIYTNPKTGYVLESCHLLFSYGVTRKYKSKQIEYNFHVC
jgi:hypothetical protein